MITVLAGGGGAARVAQGPLRVRHRGGAPLVSASIARTDLRRRGRTLSEATAEIARALGVPARVLPATDDRLRTKIRTSAEGGSASGGDGGLLDFQEVFVRRQPRHPLPHTISTR